GYGPMYFTSCPPNTDLEASMDVLFSYFDRYASPTASPGFDQFSLTSSLYSNSFELTNYAVNELEANLSGSVSVSNSKTTNELRFRSYEHEGETYICKDNNEAPTFNYRTFQFKGDPLRNNYIIYYTNEQIRSG